LDAFTGVKNAVLETMGCDESEITLNASFVDDLGCDSLDIVEIIMGVEEAFDIEVMDDDTEKMATVQDAVNLVERLVPANRLKQ
jgi:acyl carrier protein